MEMIGGFKIKFEREEERAADDEAPLMGAEK